jgi:hypothetical protein
MTLARGTWPGGHFVTHPAHTQKPRKNGIIAFCGKGRRCGGCRELPGGAQRVHSPRSGIAAWPSRTDP